MKSFKVNQALSGKKIVRACSTQFPMLSPGRIQKALRQKDVRINGKRVHTDTPVFEGDIIELWLPDNLFDADTENAALFSFLPYKIVFENDHLLIVNKAQGIAVHPGKNQKDKTLIDLVRDQSKNSQMQLCHRIDMNTGGIVILAKDSVSLDHMQKLFKSNGVVKRYRCLVRGIPDIGTPCICHDDTLMKEMSAYLEKNSASKVSIYDAPTGTGIPIITRYRVMHSFLGIGPDGEDISEIEVELVTGRTHQIRAHFAFFDHPILGDGKYGTNTYNRFFSSTNGGRIKYQQLFASSILFGKVNADNIHRNLSKRSFSITPGYEIDLIS